MMRLYATLLLAVISVACGDQAHALFPRLEDIQGGRISAWEPTANDTKRCNAQSKPRSCLHFTRRRWCVKQVEQGESTFGKSWIFSEKEVAAGEKDDFHFCNQYRFYDLVQKRAKKKKLAGIVWIALLLTK